MTGRKIKIAIDGPAASGKSTTARQVASRLNYIYIDSGAMYRAVAAMAVQKGVAVENLQEVAKIARGMHFDFRPHPSKTILFVDGQELTEIIRTPEIDRKVSPVAANHLVREILVEKQQELGKNGGIVMDGRDIGTVVFPDAELKVFMVASVAERARRRQLELAKKGIEVPLQKIEEDIEYRDLQDRSRSHGPLKKAPDALELDTTGLSIEEQVNIICNWAEAVIAGKSPVLPE
ncbi:MAG: (d)CMP kinase [Calditrichia bacterium]